MQLSCWTLSLLFAVALTAASVPWSYTWTILLLPAGIRASGPSTCDLTIYGLIHSYVKPPEQATAKDFLMSLRHFLHVYLQKLDDPSPMRDEAVKVLRRIGELTGTQHHAAPPTTTMNPTTTISIQANLQTMSSTLTPAPLHGDQELELEQNGSRNTTARPTRLKRLDYLAYTVLVLNLCLMAFLMTLCCLKCCMSQEGPLPFTPQWIRIHQWQSLLQELTSLTRTRPAGTTTSSRTTTTGTPPPSPLLMGRRSSPIILPSPDSPPTPSVPLLQRLRSLEPMIPLEDIPLSPMFPSSPSPSPRARDDAEPHYATPRRLKRSATIASARGAQTTRSTSPEMMTTKAPSVPSLIPPVTTMTLPRGKQVRFSDAPHYSQRLVRIRAQMEPLSCTGSAPNRFAPDSMMSNPDQDPREPQTRPE